MTTNTLAGICSRLDRLCRTLSVRTNLDKVSATRGIERLHRRYVIPREIAGYLARYPTVRLSEHCILGVCGNGDLDIETMVSKVGPWRADAMPIAMDLGDNIIVCLLNESAAPAVLIDAHNLEDRCLIASSFLHLLDAVVDAEEAMVSAQGDAPLMDGWPWEPEYFDKHDPEVLTLARRLSVDLPWSH